MEKISYDQYKQQLADYRDGRRRGKIMPKPNLRDVDLETVEPGKRGLIAELATREPK
ncbi:MAG: hypothetical protein IJT50_12505 [Lentisphaeria bacterium]|nr:hypothetical protein [Lentisphaeria bacterium]